MPFPLSSTYIEAKNRLADVNSWHVLAKIVFGPNPEDIMRLCDGNVDLVWNTQTWTAFPFKLESIKEGGKGEVQRVVVRVSNINKAVQYHVEQHSGGIGSEISFYVICTEDLTETAKIPTFDFEVTGCRCDAQWATFTLGGSSPYRKADPQSRMHKNFCRFDFKDGRCPYVDATYTTCNGTLTDCNDRNGPTDARFCGIFPMLGENAIYV